MIEQRNDNLILKGFTMKKLIFCAIALVALFGILHFASATDRGLTYHEVQVYDEEGEKVTDITSVEIYLPDSTTNQTIYMDSGLQNAITLPMTTGSTNTTLSSGYFYWWGDDGWDFSITDGTNIHTNSGFRTRTSSDARITFPSYLTATSTTTYSDSQSATFGTSADWVISAGAVADLMTFIPATDGAVFAIGDADDQADIYFYSSSTDYIFFDEGNKILEMVDVDIDLDDASVLTLGSGNDFEIYSDTDGILEFDPATAGNSIYFGTAHDDAVVIKWFTDVSGNYVTFDEENDEVYFTDVDIQLDDDCKLIFGSLDYDFAVYRSAANTLSFDPSTAGNEIKFGTAFGDAVDLTWYGDLTGDTVAFDEENCEVLFTDIDIQLNDDAVLILGSDDDATLQFDGTNLELFAAAIDTPFAIGGTTYGFDITYYFETSGTIDIDFDGKNMTISDDIPLVFGTNDDVSIMYDETTDDNFEILAASVGMSITTNDFLATLDGAAADQFKVDATGQIDGDAINFETTDGGVMVNADGASYGDIELNAADDIILTAAGEITVTIGGHMTIVDDDLVAFGTGNDVTLNYDEDGDDDLQVKGPVDFETTYCLFESNPVGSKITGAAGGTVGGTTGDENAMAVDGTNFEYHILGAGQTITAPSITANGLDLRLDAIDDEGMELGEGITARSKSAFTIGTDAFYLKVKVYVTDVNDFDILACGFRLAEAYQSDIYAYNTYAGINVNNGAMNGIDELNGASAHETDMEEDLRDGVAFTMEVRISAAKAVTQYLNGTAVTTPLAFSWTDTDTVVPFFHILGDASAAGEVAIQLWECGLQ